MEDNKVYHYKCSHCQKLMMLSRINRNHHAIYCDGIKRTDLEFYNTFGWPKYIYS